MIQRLDHVLDLLILCSTLVFIVLVIEGIRFTMRTLHDFRYGRVEEDDGPESPTSVAEF